MIAKYYCTTTCRKFDLMREISGLNNYGILNNEYLLIVFGPFFRTFNIGLTDMAFQFFCPNRHLLQANENQVGQICRCPMCQTEFLIPSPTGQPTPTPQPIPVQPSASAPSQPAPNQTSESLFSLNKSSKSNDKFNFLGAQESAAQESSGFNIEKAESGPEEASSDEKSKAGFKLSDVDNDPILHSVCPNGHILEIEREMLGERAMCPYCNTAFSITLERTVEYLEKQKREAEREDNKLAKFWSQWAIVAAVLAAIFIIFMVVLGMK